MCKLQRVPSPFVVSKLASNNLKGKENAWTVCTPTLLHGKTKTRHAMLRKINGACLLWLQGCRKTSGLSEAHLPKMETIKWLLGNKERKNICVQISLKINNGYNDKCGDSSGACQLPSRDLHQPPLTKAVTLSMNMAWWRRAHFNNAPVKPLFSTSRLWWMDGCRCCSWEMKLICMPKLDLI